MPRELAVRTPENVEITQSLAGIGSRFAAIFIDHSIQGVTALILMSAMVLLVGGVRDWFTTLDDIANLSGWAIAILVLLYFLLFWGYFIFFEAFWNGQTPGKRLLNIRVVKENGQPIDFFTAAIRNIVRIVDLMPSAYAAGVTTMFFSPAYKRLGDYAAGTVVVKEYREAKPQNSKAESRRSNAPESDPVPAETPSFSPYDTAPLDERSDIPGVTVPSIRHVTRDEYDAARRFLDRRADLPGEMSATFARRIAEPMLARHDLVPEDPDRYPYELFLETLAHDYLRWQDRGY